MAAETENAPAALGGAVAPLGASVAENENFFPDEWRKKLEEALHSRKYSAKTRKMYLHYNAQLCRDAQKLPPAVTARDVKRYIAYLDETLERSAATMNLAISAIKFFYTEVVENPAVRESSRPRQDRRLPLVLSKPKYTPCYPPKQTQSTSCFLCSHTLPALG
jgi:hypothetical protein